MPSAEEERNGQPKHKENSRKALNNVLSADSKKLDVKAGSSRRNLSNTSRDTLIRKRRLTLHEEAGDGIFLKFLPVLQEEISAKRMGTPKELYLCGSEQVAHGNT